MNFAKTTFLKRGFHFLLCDSEYWNNSWKISGVDGELINSLAKNFLKINNNKKSNKVISLF